ncbi:MAG: 50S ribosomal protein L29 [Holosporaceae bacterium]|jgi:ribosomal protein L29|nr:50S ribosomal protein L29 [Holosporaceae bacterium]
MTKKNVVNEVESSKREAMRIRFRRVLGETVPSHTIREIRRKIAKHVKNNCEMRGKDA